MSNWSTTAIESNEIWPMANRAAGIFSGKLAELEKQLKSTKPSSIQSLAVADETLKTLPGWVYELTGLKSLALTFLPARALDRQIGKLVNLTSLHLASEVDDLRAAVDLPRLESLTIPQHCFAQVPARLRTTLRRLSFNGVEPVPPEVAQCGQLEELSARYSSSIPKEVAALTQLQLLNLTGNASIQSLPLELAGMKSLTMLDADGCIELRLGPPFAPLMKQFPKVEVPPEASESKQKYLKAVHQIRIRAFKAALARGASLPGAAESEAPHFGEHAAGVAFLKKMEAAIREVAKEYEAELPSLKQGRRYLEFIAGGEYEKYEKLSGEFYDSPHTFKFTDKFLFEHFATSECFDSIVNHFDEKAEAAFSLWPFTQLWGGPGKSSSVALYVDLSKAKCPIFSFDEGRLRKQSPSLDEFLGSLGGAAGPAPQAAPAAPKPAGAGGFRRFEMEEKFWAIQLAGRSLTVRFGKLGTAGQEKTKSFSDDAAAQKEYEKLLREKTNKGYEET